MLIGDPERLGLSALPAFGYIENGQTVPCTRRLYTFTDCYNELPEHIVINKDGISDLGHDPDYVARIVKFISAWTLVPRRIYGRPWPASAAIRAVRPHSSEVMLKTLEDRATYAAVLSDLQEIFDADSSVTVPMEDAP